MNETRLRIAIAEDEVRLLKDLEEMLVELGHTVVAAATNGRELVEKCQRVLPDLIVTDIKMPDMDGIEAAERIRQNEATPVVLLSAHSDATLIERALQGHALSYLIKPVTLEQLGTGIALAVRRFEEFKALRREANSIRKALADRKVIERAKGVLMKQASLGEEEAFRRLQDLASTKHQKLVKIAESILVMHEALKSPRDD